MEVVIITTNFVDKVTEVKTVRNSFSIAYSECIVGNPDEVETVIACHGFTSSRTPLVKTILSEIVKNAHCKGESIRVIALDWPGHGESGSANKYSLALLRNCLLAFMKNLSIEKAHIFGMSMGGIAGILFSAAHPEKVLTLTVQGAPIHAKDITRLTRIVGTATISPALLLRRYIPNSLEFIPRGAIDKVIPLYSLLGSIRKLKDIKALVKNPDVRNACIDDIRNFSLRAFYDLIWEFLTLDTVNELEIIRESGLPVLVLDGDDPEYVFFDTLPQLREVLDGPDTYAFYINGVGHAASILKPKETADYFDYFLDKTKNTWQMKKAG